MKKNIFSIHDFSLLADEGVSLVEFADVFYRKYHKLALARDMMSNLCDCFGDTEEARRTCLLGIAMGLNVEVHNPSAPVKLIAKGIKSEIQRINEMIANKSLKN